MTVRLLTIYVLSTQQAECLIHQSIIQLNNKFTKYEHIIQHHYIIIYYINHVVPKANFLKTFLTFYRENIELNWEWG
jgi:hypothetical protein